MREVWRLRDAGTPCWFSIDTGATVYVNTLPGHQDEIAQALAGIDGVDAIRKARAGGPVRSTTDHLF
jgi:phosphomevalonate decarboxylase